ncbi:putative serine esterase (DUF676) family protein [Theileria parva strain Muguga]|uniref:DUF676 domain-containing protein n=1 Tax=Theileria parva TaxID=5875 RepID=Q4N006_THEPA|nr:putative serine esterase (DUF676) family protein [Theileria parva strain Muguga]EAN31083.1 putative serine esterase (DUF676) family protein [Theileria parva strain Muguga]|eukprot:XP_763366.1 hypothetical protein [Theileria parva strain Muguga]
MGNSKPSSLCYHCTVSENGKGCYKDKCVDDSEKNGPDNLKSFKESLYAAYLKAMSLKTIFSASFSDFLNYFGSFMDDDVTLNEQNSFQLKYSRFPDNVLRCDSCLCYFSASSFCHCKDCSGGEECHYVILMHGIISTPLMMTDICIALLEAYPNLFVYFPVSACKKTLRGTSYVIRLIIDELKLLFAKIPSNFKLSLIGHSYGGILLRYFLLYYLLNKKRFFGITSNAPNDTNHTTPYSSKPSDSDNTGCNDVLDHDYTFFSKEIVWKNFIFVATPLAGTFENNLEFMRLANLIGSDTISELDNKTIDLLFLLKSEGFLDKFEKVVAYGNISGDMMVAPRTSLILPNYLVTDEKLREIAKVLYKYPGQPANINMNNENLQLVFDNVTKVIHNSNPHSTDDSFADELTDRFNQLLDNKIKNTNHMKFIEDMLDNSPLFTAEDKLKFTKVISDIVRTGNVDEFDKFDDDDFFYHQILMGLLDKLKIIKFAVYIPRIHFPHRSIITYQSPISNERYTYQILENMVNIFEK